jgi:hypothetical protein
MEQPHDYNETFGFINALSEHDDGGYGIMQSQEIDGSGTQKQESSDFTPPSTAAPPSDSVQYHDITSSSQVAINQKADDAFDIQSDPILEQQSSSQQQQVPLAAASSPSNTITKKESAVGKKRKRIVVNDDEDSDGSSELKRDILSKAIDEESQEHDEKNNELENSAGGGDEADVESGENDEETSEIVNPDALKARFLLKSAIIIHDPDKKKKKKQRVLDSDDEDQQLQQPQVQTSIDDIGLVAENESEIQNEDEAVVGEGIIIFNDPPTFESAQEEEKSGEKIEGAASEVARGDDAKEIPAQTETTPPSDDQKSEIQIKTEYKSEKPENDDNIDEVLERIKPMADDEYVE